MDGHQWMGTEEKVKTLCLSYSGGLDVPRQAGAVVTSCIQFALGVSRKDEPFISYSIRIRFTPIGSSSVVDACTRPHMIGTWTVWAKMQGRLCLHTSIKSNIFHTRVEHDIPDEENATAPR